jgi:hypothetical protein
MRDFLVVIINVGDLGYADLALKAQRKYYAHFNIPLEVLERHHPETGATSPSWIRCLIHEMYEADFILVHGLDMLPCNLKYDIRDFLDVWHVNLAVDCTMIGADPEKHHYPHFRYNADMLGYPRDMMGFFRGVWEDYHDDPFYKDTFEQYCMNKELFDQRVYVNEIPNLFNRFYHPGFDYAKNAFCHYTCHMASREKRTYIEQYHPKEMME